MKYATGPAVSPLARSCLGLCCCLFGLVDCSAGERPPNIVFVMADDLGYGDLSCFGQSHFATPHLDRLSRGGLRLTQHYAGSTVCAPSRCALMTGQHTGHCPVRGNRGGEPDGQYPLAAEAVTIAEVLQRAGYATGAFGKWGLGYTGNPGDPLRQGFDQFFGYKCQRAAHRYYPDFLWHNDEQVVFDRPTYSHDVIMEQTLEFIRAHRDQPFFCYVPVTIPHAAMEVPAADHARFREKFPQFESKIGKYAGTDVVNPIAAFAAMVSRLDSDVGRIADLLQELEIDEDTILVFTSDNGPHAEGGHDPKFFASSGPWRGIKRDLYEGGIRVPTIVYWPGTIAPGRESDHLSAFWDWMPTLTELADTKCPEWTDGISLRATLLDHPGQRPHEYLYWEFHERGGKQAIRQGDWKAIRLNVNENAEGPLELYDLKTDSHESTDVAATHPEMVAGLAKLMTEARTPSAEFQFAGHKRRSRRIGATTAGDPVPKRTAR